MNTDSVMENYGKACAALRGMAALINDPSPLPPLKATGRPSFTCNVTGRSTPISWKNPRVHL